MMNDKNMILMLENNLRCERDRNLALTLEVSRIKRIAGEFAMNLSMAGKQLNNTAKGSGDYFRDKGFNYIEEPL